MCIIFSVHFLVIFAFLESSYMTFLYNKISFFEQYLDCFLFFAFLVSNLKSTAQKLKVPWKINNLVLKHLGPILGLHIWWLQKTMKIFHQILLFTLLVCNVKCLNITSIPILEITEDDETTKPPLLAMTEHGLVQGKLEANHS